MYPTKPKLVTDQVPEIRFSGSIPGMFFFQFSLLPRPVFRRCVAFEKNRLFQEAIVLCLDSG